MEWEDYDERNGFSGGQIIGMLNGAEATVKIPEVCRRHRITPNTFTPLEINLFGIGGK